MDPFNTDLRKLQEAWEEFDEAGDTRKANRLESLIVSGLNGRWAQRYVPKTYRDTTRLIVRDFEEAGMTGAARHTGSGQLDKNSLNPYYLERFREYGGKQINSTPKTDLITNDGDIKVSLKSGKGWLFAQKLVDSHICFDYVLDHGKHSNAIRKKLHKAISDVYETTTSEIEKLDNKHSSVKLETIGGDIVNAVIDQLNTIINTESFKIDFIKKGCSGEFKFGDGEGTANKIVYVQATNVNMSTEALLQTPQKYKGIVVVDFDDDEHWKSIHSRYNPEFRVINKNIHFWLKEEMLREGIFDKIKQGWESVKGFVVNVFKKLLEYLKGGVSRLMKFLGFEKEISLENEAF